MTTVEVITRTGKETLAQGVGEHRPTWTSGDCPSCGSAPCGRHPEILICPACDDDWAACPVAKGAATELRRLATEYRALHQREIKRCTRPVGQCARCRKLRAQIDAVCGWLTIRADNLERGRK